MPSSAQPPVAFSLTAPLGTAARAVRAEPGRALGPVLLMLVPVLPLLLGVEGVLRRGGSAALQGVIAGAPDGTPGALITRPDTSGWLLLAALWGLVAALLAVVWTAAVVAGAQIGPPDRVGRTSEGSAGLRDRLAVWPSILVAVTLQVLVLGGLAGVVVALARLAGSVQFQLSAAVLTLGLGALAFLGTRLSLWPTIALAEDRGALSALRTGLRVSRGSTVRLVGALIGTVLAVAVPVVVFAFAVSAVLTLLAGAETIALSPVAIQLWSLLPVPFGFVLAVVLWARQTPTLHAALVRFARERDDAGT